MKKIKRIYCASIATETNNYLPLRTHLENFKETFYAKTNKHHKTPNLYSAIFLLLRKKNLPIIEKPYVKSR